jgi:hypothetical protein
MNPWPRLIPGPGRAAWIADLGRLRRFIGVDTVLFADGCLKRDG